MLTQIYGAEWRHLNELSRWLLVMLFGTDQGYKFNLQEKTTHAIIICKIQIYNKTSQVSSMIQQSGCLDFVKSIYFIFTTDYEKKKKEKSRKFPCKEL